jgi:hypothetical protein
MGSSFNNMLVENTSLDTLRQSLEKVFKSSGYVLAGEEADCIIRAYGAPDDRYFVLTGEWPEEDMDKLAGRIAKAIGGRAIGVQCIDSDVLLLSLTKGSAVSIAYVGDPEAYGITPKPLRVAFWKELVGEDNWDAFHAVLDDKYVLAEEALQPLGRMIGFSAKDAARYPDDPGKPRMVCAYKREKIVPEYLSNDLPPAFLPAGYALEQGSLVVSFTSGGGHSHGIGALIASNGFDGSGLEIQSIRIARAFYHFRERKDIEAKPKKVRFEDRRIGWVAAFPDAEILPGANPDHPKANSLEGLERQDHRKYYVIFPAWDGWVIRNTMDMTTLGKELTMDVYLIPLQNRKGEAAVRIGFVRSADGDILQ